MGQPLYLRKISLITSNAQEAIDFTEFKIVFKVKQWDLQTPNNLFARVYNVAPQTIQRVNAEFTRVTLSAGYQKAQFGTIFDGTIVQTKSGRENATDTYLDIIAADGDMAANFATINQTLAAGSKPNDRIGAAAQAMQGSGVTAGQISDLGGNPLPRGRVMFGLARDPLRTIAQDQQVNWTVQNQQLNVFPITGFLPSDAIVLTSSTGLIGIPEQTQEGIKIRSLLNAQIRAGQRVQVDNASINRFQLAVDIYGQVNNAILPRVAEDGFYRVVVAEHSGDSRGNDWYTDMICIAMDDAVTPGLATRAYS